MNQLPGLEIRFGEFVDSNTTSCGFHFEDKSMEQQCECVILYEFRRIRMKKMYVKEVKKQNAQSENDQGLRSWARNL